MHQAGHDRCPGWAQFGHKPHLIESTSFPKTVACWRMAVTPPAESRLLAHAPRRSPCGRNAPPRPEYTSANNANLSHWTCFRRKLAAKWKEPQ